MADRWTVVTRYVRPSDGRIVRHVYVDDDGLPYMTRAGALGHIRRMLRDERERFGEGEVDKALATGRLEVNAVRIVDIPLDIPT